jgi:hypothetical protein
MTTTPTHPAAYRIARVQAPALMGAALRIDLTPQTNGTGELLAAVADQPGRWHLTGTLFLLSGLAWTVAGNGLLRMLGDRSRLVGVAGALLATGGAALALLDAAGVYLPAVAGSATSPQEQIQIVEHVEGAPLVVAGEIVHLVGWGLGMLVLVLGLLVSRAVPRWIAGLLLLSLVGISAFVSGALLAAAVTAHVAALAAVAVSAAREPASRVTPQEFVRIAGSAPSR